MAEQEVRNLEAMFKELETLMNCLSDWNSLILSHFESKELELKDIESKLFAETYCNKTLNE